MIAKYVSDASIFVSMSVALLRLTFVAELDRLNLTLAFPPECTYGSRKY